MGASKIKSSVEDSCIFSSLTSPDRERKDRVSRRRWPGRDRKGKRYRSSFPAKTTASLFLLPVPMRRSRKYNRERRKGLPPDVLAGSADDDPQFALEIHPVASHEAGKYDGIARVLDGSGSLHEDHRVFR